MNKIRVARYNDVSTFGIGLLTHTHDSRKDCQSMVRDVMNGKVDQELTIQGRIMFASNSPPSVSVHRPPESGDSGEAPNVLDRLKSRMQEARGLGFQIRIELLGDQASSWCEVGGSKLLFLDVAQTATEQLQQLESLLDQYEEYCRVRQPVRKAAG